MKVKRLVELLKQEDQDADVMVYDIDNDKLIRHIITAEWSDADYEDVEVEPGTVIITNSDRPWVQQ